MTPGDDGTERGVADGASAEEGIYGAGQIWPQPLERGVFLVDKPKGWSSFDVIRKLRRVLGIRKIGHAGTLDPMATGLLICCAGRDTKRVHAFMGLDKTYTGTFRLGATTPSYDAETEVQDVRPWEHVDEAALRHAMAGLTGTILQKPPMYSAVKVGGERLYKKARRGEVVKRPAREVEVHTFSLTGRADAEVSFEVTCSKGTYVRTLAHDAGQVLGCGAYLTALRRTAIGPYHVDRAWTIAALERTAEQATSAT